MLLHSTLSEDTCSANVGDDATVPFDQIGFLPLSFLVLCGWFLLNKFYNFIVKVLLYRLSIKDLEVKRLLTVYWNISFTIITIPFALHALSIPLNQFTSEFYNNLESNVAGWFTQESVSVKTKMIYILLTGYFLNQVCQISIEKGLKNLDFVVSEFFAVFFVSSFAYRCIRFGIAFMILFNSAQSFLEMTRMLYCFSKIYPSKLADICTRLFFLIHALVWTMIFFHLVPNYFLLLTLRSVVTSIDDASHVLILMLLNAALWGFYILHIISSPLSKLMLEFILQRPCTLEWLLFGNSPLPKHVYMHSSATFYHNSVPVVTTQKKKINAELARKQNSKENLSKVYQTVRCYIRIKRKLNRIRTKLKEKHESEDAAIHISESDVLECDNIDMDFSISDSVEAVEPTNDVCLDNDGQMILPQ